MKNSFSLVFIDYTNNNIIHHEKRYKTVSIAREQAEKMASFLLSTSKSALIIIKNNQGLCVCSMQWAGKDKTANWENDLFNWDINYN